MSDETAPVLVTVPLAVTLDTLKGLSNFINDSYPNSQSGLAFRALWDALFNAEIAAENAVMNMPAPNADVLAWKFLTLRARMENELCEEDRRWAALTVSDMRRFGLLDAAASQQERTNA